MEEEELVIDKNDPNKALSYSAPLYLYYTNTSSVFDPTFEFSDFKFEQCQHTKTSTGPTTVSFADELFHSGVLLPLKLPPRLQSCGGSNSGPVSPTMSSIFKSSFVRPNLNKNKDFDPFMVALQKIRKEETCERHRELQPPRRSRSLSPLRNLNFVRKKENQLQKLDSSRETFLQSDEGSMIATGDSNITTSKTMLRKKKQNVLKMIKPPNVNYKRGLFTCFRIRL